MARNNRVFGGKETRAGQRRAVIPQRAKQTSAIPQNVAKNPSVPRVLPTKAAPQAQQNANLGVGAIPQNVTQAATPNTPQTLPQQAAPQAYENANLGVGNPQIAPIQAQGAIPQNVTQAPQVLPQQAAPQAQANANLGVGSPQPAPIQAQPPQMLGPPQTLPQQAAPQAYENANLGLGNPQPAPVQAQGIPQILPIQAQPPQMLGPPQQAVMPGAIPPQAQVPPQFKPMPSISPPMPGNGDGQIRPAISPLPTYPKMPTESAGRNPRELTQPWGKVSPENSRLQSLLSGFLSDETKKEDIRDLDDEDALRKIGNVPVYKYKYKEEHREAIGDHGEERLGPMAQDWAREFGGPSNIIAMPQMIGALVGAVRALDKRTTQKG